MLILGGSATVTDLTGANTVAVCFLIPLGVSVYVLAGGMRASLIADYSHTLVLYAARVCLYRLCDLARPRLAGQGVGAPAGCQQEEPCSRQCRGELFDDEEQERVDLWRPEHRFELW